MAALDFDESTIRALATDQSYYRGEAYFEEGAVRGLKLQGDTYQAYVYGSRRYTVKISGSGKDIETSCTCPYDWGGACKHTVAVMLAILKGRETVPKEHRPSLPQPEAEAPAVQIDEILASLSADALRAFVRLQAGEIPELADDLRIFSQGTAETEKTVEAYEAEIAAALEEGDFGDPDEEEDYEYDDDRYYGPDEDDHDTVEGLLAPYCDTARKYYAQGNWMESAKIHEAILHACGKIAIKGGYSEDEDEEDYEEEEEEGYEEDEDFDLIYTDYEMSECLAEAKMALAQWAEALASAPEEDKQRALERFVEAFAGDPYSLGAANWEGAFKSAVRTASGAKAALTAMKRLKVRFLYQDANKAGALLHLLNLSGDAEEFVKVGKNAIRRYPHLALPLGEKLLEMGRRDEAVQAAETALEKTRAEDDFHFGKDQAREALLRFLVRTYDPEKEYARLVECAETLVFEEEQLDDYLFLRDTLKTAEEREKLIQGVKKRNSPEALIDILSREERWEDLLDCARKHTDAPGFPDMIRALQGRFPEECFEIYRKVLWRVVDSGTGERIYRHAAHHARQMRGIPGREEAFARLMAEIVDKYSRRTGLMRALGDMAELGRA